MRLSPRIAVYVVAVLALAAGALAYGLSDHEEEHEEEGLIAGDSVKVVAAVAVLGVVAVASFAYLAKNPPQGG